MKTIRTLVSLLAAALLVVAAGVPSVAQYAPSAGSNLSRDAGRFVAVNYNYPSTNNYVVNGNSATGTASINVQVAKITLPDGRRIFPYNIFTPIIVGNGSNQELVTPTSVSNCYYNSSTGNGQCLITASFANTHGFGDPVISGTGGLAEAIYDAFLAGGGVVTLDNNWASGVNTGCTGCYGSANLAISTGLVPFPSVFIEDLRQFAPVYWNVQASTATLYVAPSALASGTVSSSTTVAGSASYTGGTIHVGYECVDPMGNAGPISADYSFADTSAKAIVFTAPPAYSNCVGWVPVIGIESGAANNEYEMPLVTQPTVVGAAPVSNGVCTLTTIETIRPACAITNATYGQTGSGATVTGYPVVTSPQTFQLGGVSSTSYYAPNSMARTGYAYTPGSHVAAAGVVASSGPSTVSAALGSTVPFVLGSVQLPANFMNSVGKTIRICGQVYFSAMGADTVQAIRFGWDAQGSDVTTGIPVFLGGPKDTSTLTSAASAASFCQTLETTVASASATGGSIRATNGWYGVAGSSAGANPFFGINNTVAAVGSLNLAESAVIDIVFVATTGTTDTPILTNVTVEVLN